jgi:hypothetical protein
MRLPKDALIPHHSCILDSSLPPLSMYHLRHPALFTECGCPVAATGSDGQ